MKFLFLQGKGPKEIHAIPTETLACFLPGRAKDLLAPLYNTLQSCDFDSWIKEASGMERFSVKRLSAKDLWGGLLYWGPWKIC